VRVPLSELAEMVVGKKKPKPKQQRLKVIRSRIDAGVSD